MYLSLIKGLQTVVQRGGETTDESESAGDDEPH